MYDIHGISLVCLKVLSEGMRVSETVSVMLILPVLTGNSND